MAIYERTVNDAESILTTAIVSGATSLAVTNADSFPTDGVFRVIIDNEIIRVDTVSGTTFNVVRGVDGTTPANHVLGSQVTAIVTSGSISRILEERIRGFAGRPPFRIADANENILTSSDFTTHNDTDLTVYDNAGGSITLESTTEASITLAKIIRTAPTAPYVIEGAYSLNSVGGTSAPFYGPFFRRSSTDGVVMAWHKPLLGTDYEIYSINHYSGDTFQNDIGGKFHGELKGTAINWFKIEDDNTDLKIYQSGDGVNYHLMLQQTRTTELGAAPDQVGFLISNTSDGFTTNVNLLAWQE